MVRHRPQQGQRSVTGQHLLDQYHCLVPLDLLDIGRQIVDLQAPLHDGRANAAQPKVLQLPGG